MGETTTAAPVAQWITGKPGLVVKVDRGAWELRLVAEWQKEGEPVTPAMLTRVEGEPVYMNGKGIGRVWKCTTTAIIVKLSALPPAAMAVELAQLGFPMVIRLTRATGGGTIMGLHLIPVAALETGDERLRRPEEPA